MRNNHSTRPRVFFHTIVFLVTLFCVNVIFAQSESLTKNAADKSNTNNLHSLKLAVQQSKLTADDATTLDFFGFSVSLSGNRALIGVRGKRAAYVFELTNGIWTQTAKLVATDVALNFGVSVSLSGDRALIGANQSASLAGAAYVFDFANGIWAQTAKLTANDAAAGDQFGVSVNLSVDNRALIGAPFDDDGGFIDAGSAYVFELSGGMWTQIAKLTASDQAANDEFGISVSLSGAPINLFIARALIGAAKNESAYIFESIGANWLETNILKANMGTIGDQFGRSVSLYDNTALVGAYKNKDNGINTGKVYVFDYSLNVWPQSAQLEPDVIIPGSLFGFSVSLSSTQALIGAYGSSTAYLFDFANFNWTQASILTTSNGNASDFFGFSVSLSNNVSLVGAYGDNAQGNFTGAAYIFGGNPFYNIGGTVSGLATGNTIELENNNLDAIVVGNGTFLFNSNLADLAAYSVVVKTAPTSPNQTCSITGGSNGDGSGTINAANVTNLLVVCTVNQYNLGVAVNGLATGNTIELTSNGQNLIFNTDGTSSFPNPIDDGSNYAVLLTAQPGSPNQICSISGGSNIDGSGTITGADVLINVDCTTTQYSIGVTITGLFTGNSVILQNNASDDLTVNTNGVVNNFTIQLDDNSGYFVTVLTQPSTPNQQCVVDPRTSSGSINGADVVIAVICTTIQYNLGATVNGLAIGNSIELTSNGQSLTFNADGSANFSAAIDDGSDYTLALTSQPTSPGQFCNITGGSNGNGSGTFMGSDVLVTITCSVLELTIDNRLLDFGTVIIGTSNNLTVTLSNNSSGTILIAGFTPLNAPFSIAGGSCVNFPISLLPNQSCQLIVELNAQNLGDFNASFDIISNVLSSPDTIGLLVSVQAVQINIIPTLNVFSLFFIIIMVLVMAMQNSKHLIKPQFD